jgi:hypothetical protein
VKLLSPPKQSFSVAYLEDERFAALAKSARSSFISLPAALYTPKSIEWDGLKFPARTVVVPYPPEPGTTREVRISFGGKLVHEIAHAHGANEWEARVTQRDYLVKNGLRGPSDKQIFAELVATLAKKDEINSAELVAFGNTGSMLRSLVRTYWVICTEGLYRE